MEVLDAASFDIVDDSDDIAAAVVVVGIDSCYFRHFRYHPYTMAIAVVVDFPGLLVSLWLSK